MDKIKREMLKVYKPISNLDWMNYKLSRKDITFHHIQKRSSGGKRTIENGALLMPIAHEYLHLIEFRDVETYELINNLFKVVNKQGCEPTYEQRLAMEYLLREFESVHRWDKGRKGKLLLQRKYLKRGWNNV